MVTKEITSHYTGLAVVIALVITILLLLVFGNNIKLEYNPPYLRLALNVIFISATNIFVAIIALRSFLRHGQISLALLGGALVASGSAAFISGGVTGVPTDGAFVVFNVGFLLSSIMQAFGAVYLSAASPASKVFSSRKIITYLILLLPIFTLLVLTALSIYGLTPPFIDQFGTSTDLRQFVIALSFVFFVFASSIFAYQYFRTKGRALYWYSLALALFALDTVVGFYSAQLGDILQWVGRISDYVGGIFFIIALIALQQQAFVGANFSERLFEVFSNNRYTLASLFANMSSGFAYLRIIEDNKKPVDAVFVEVNDAFQANTGLKKEEVTGKALTQAINGIERDPANWIGFLGDIGLKRQPARAEKYMQGLERWFRVSAYSPENRYVAVLFEDITKEKQLNQQLEDYTKNLEKIVEERTQQLRKNERMAAIGQTAGMVGHDIRNPLQAITGDLYLIEEEVKTKPTCISPGIAESISSINDNIAYINKIVSDLQDYTRTLKPAISTVGLKEIIASVLTARKVPENITINLPQTELKLKTDPTFLRRIITNLLTNAIQAMPNGGKLTINADTKGKVAYICIQDTGIGIPKEAQAKLFTPLFTTKAKGQGLGLAVVKRLVEALNGKITFESYERGTTFTVELPLNN